MSRVSENSSTNAINFSVSKTKSKLEDLQIKGANLKRLQKPSDDPIGNSELLSIRSMKADSQQYTKNANFTKAQLEFTENAISDLTDIVMKAKEIAVAQSSSIYNEDIRKNVAEEINQMRQQALGVANRRLGNRYLFSGHKTLTPAFNERGVYQGDNGKSFIEVGKDFFVEANINGLELLGVKEKPKAVGDETKINITPDASHPEMPAKESLSYPELERSLASSPEIVDQKPNLIDQSQSKTYSMILSPSKMDLSLITRQSFNQCSIASTIT
jgi:flagellar hook-associated protein 3 FlgL